MIAEKLRSYLEHRYADDIAAGWQLAARGRQVLLWRAGAGAGAPTVREIELPAHLRTVADAVTWHAAHQAGALFSPGVGLFATPEAPHPTLF